MLNKEQIIQLREAFNMIDVDSDSVITKNDLITILDSIGSPFTEEEINEMMVIPEISFVYFLSLIAEKISCFDDEKIIRSSLNEFAENGKIKFDELRNWLGMSESELQGLVKGCMIDSKFIDLEKMATVLRHGEVINIEK